MEIRKSTRIITLATLLSVFTCIQFTMAQQDLGNVKHIQYTVPIDLVLLDTQATKDRKIYQNEQGVTLAFSKKTLEIDQKQAQILASLSLFKLKENMKDFELLYEQRELQVNNFSFCFFIYSYKEGNDTIKCYSYHTVMEKEFVTFLFYCPDIFDDEWRDIFGEILLSVSFS